MLLALDTATSAVTVAVADGARVLAERAVVDARRHTELLAPSIQQVLAEAGLRPRDLTAVAVGVGPGPFTGLRVGIVTARTMGLALGIPVYGVCSLDALAHRAVAEQGLTGAFLVATDARRKEVYWAAYDAAPAGGDAPAFARRRSGPAVDRPGELPAAVRALPVVGRGAELYADLLGEPVPVLDVSAAALAAFVALALAGDGQEAQLLEPAPLYLRRPDAVPQAARKPVLP